MKPLAASLAALALLAGAATEAEDTDRRARRTADPSAIVAAEIARGRLSREKGEWTAALETAAPGAEMFTPQRVKAEEWLKNRPNPAATPGRQTDAVWSSCDGSIAVARGTWQLASSTGRFATVWQRQPKGGYKWLLDMRLAPEEQGRASDMITAIVADCSGPRLVMTPGMTLQVGHDVKTGLAADGSLRWTIAVLPGGARRFTLVLRQDGEGKEVLDLSAPAEPAGQISVR